MIVLLGGTAEGRQLAEELLDRGFAVTACTATEYGGSLLPARAGLTVSSRRLSPDELKRLVADQRVQAVVDATHPFAAKISSTAREACRQAGKPYWQYRRPDAVISWDNSLVVSASNWEEAAAKAASLGEHIFLATGSKWLPDFGAHPALKGKRLVVRVLPVPESLQVCLNAGIAPGNVVAMQGPFSRELNAAIYRHYGIQVVVTKESGAAGGTEAKVEAAVGLNIPVVVIRRPGSAAPAAKAASWEEFLAKIPVK